MSDVTITCINSNFYFHIKKCVIESTRVNEYVHSISFLVMTASHMEFFFLIIIIVISNVLNLFIVSLGF
jgi:hypothetical protein